MTRVSAFRTMLQPTHWLELRNFFMMWCNGVNLQRSGQHICVTSGDWIFLRRPTTTTCTNCLWTWWNGTRGHVTGTLTGLNNNW